MLTFSPAIKQALTWVLVPFTTNLVGDLALSQVQSTILPSEYDWPLNVPFANPAHTASTNVTDSLTVPCGASVVSTYVAVTPAPSFLKIT